MLHGPNGRSPNRPHGVTVIYHGVIDLTGITTPDVRQVVERVCARQDVLDACSNGELGIVIEV
jgi:hypothetical protein